MTMCYATDVLTDDWQELPALRDRAKSEADRDWLFMRLEDMTEYGKIERRYEQITRHGHPAGFRIFYRRKP